MPSSDGASPRRLPLQLLRQACPDSSRLLCKAAEG
eukprot:gene10897-32440_t